MVKKTKATKPSSLDKACLKAFGRKLGEVRQRKKLSVYDLTGEDMPIKSRQHWQDIENGKKNINLTTLLKIARSLEVGADELVAKLA